VHDDKGVRLADREIWLDQSLDGTTGLRVGGLPGTSRFLAPWAFTGTYTEIDAETALNQ
jgi:hypothetical protein